MQGWGQKAWDAEDSFCSFFKYMGVVVAVVVFL